MAGEKVCVVCREDCSGRARSKDASGRYVCGSCLEKKKAERAGGKPDHDAGLADGGGHAAALLADLPQMAPDAKSCDGCGTLVKPDQVICTKCGQNQRTGKSTKTAVAKHARGDGPGSRAAKAGFEAAGPVIGAIGGLVGGVVGAGIWAGIAYATGYEIGWIAVLIGILVGGGTFVASGGRAGLVGGLYAAGIALLAVAGGRYAAFQLMTEQVTRQFEGATASTVTFQEMEGWIVDDIARDWMAEGRSIDWQNGATIETAAYPSDYPLELVTAAGTAVQEMSREERDELREEVVAAKQAFREMADGFVEDVFMSSLDYKDAIFAFLAIAAAFKIAGIETE